MSADVNIDWQAAALAENAQMIPTGSDAEFMVTFYMGKLPNFEMTDYKEVPHIRLQAPGSRTVYDQPVRLESYPDRPSDPERFPLAWAAFQRGENLGGNGTLLIDWEEATPGDVRSLEINGIRTVEQLAGVSDNNLQGLGFGGRMIRERARLFVSGRGRADPEKAALKQQLGEQAEQIGKLTDVVASLLERLGEPSRLVIPDASTTSSATQPPPAASRRSANREPVSA